MLERALDELIDSSRAALPMLGPLTGDAVKTAVHAGDHDRFTEDLIGHYEWFGMGMDMQHCLSTLVTSAKPPEGVPDMRRLQDECQDALEAWWPALRKAHTLVLNEEGVARAIALWEDYERESAFEIDMWAHTDVVKFIGVVRAAKREGQGVILLAGGAEYWDSKDEHVAMES